MSEMERLESDFINLSKHHKRDPSNVPVSKLDAAWTALNLALTTKEDKSIRWSGAKFYQTKDKIGTMLAHKLSSRLRSHALPKIKQADGTFTIKFTDS